MYFGYLSLTTAVLDCKDVCFVLISAARPREGRTLKAGFMSIRNKLRHWFTIQLHAGDSRGPALPGFRIYYANSMGT